MAINLWVKRIEGVVKRLTKPKRLKHRYKILIGALILTGLVVGGYFLFRNANFGILSPRGTIAVQQKRLIVFASLLSLTVVLPVFTMTFYIVWKYRASNTRSTYRPDWDHSLVAETIWWLLPTMLISVLSVVTWRSSYALDPFKKLDSTVKPLRVQVVALQWKWLFIYPEQNIASVNELHIPVDTPINFEITADAPMNSFWIPQLGGQIYAMAGMTTQLHLMASEPGSYYGSSANISGEGFAGMNFQTIAEPKSQFDVWVGDTKKSGLHLTFDAYNELSEPSSNNQPMQYPYTDNKLYDWIVMKYMSPANNVSGAYGGGHGSGH